MDPQLGFDLRRSRPIAVKRRKVVATEGFNMSDPRYTRERHNHSAPFRSIVLVFAAVMCGLVAYAYIHMAQAPVPSGSSPDQTTGQSGTKAPTPTPRSATEP